MKAALLKIQSKRKGGLEKYAERIAAAFSAKGTSVTILTTDIPSEQNPSVSYQIFSVPAWPRFFRLHQFDQRVRNWLKSNHFDIVFDMEPIRMQTHIRAGNGVHAAYLKSRLLSEGSVKYGLCRLDPLHRTILRFQKEAFANPSLQKIFANSAMVKKELLEHHNVDSSRIEVVHNGVEWEEKAEGFHQWKDSKEQAMSRLSLDPSCLQILFIGHGYRRKGLDPLLRALSLWRFRDFQLSVVGRDRNIARYQSTLASLGLEKHVRFFGSQREVLPFYQLADILAIPSFYDPFANVTVEALAMGLFVVSSKYNGGHEVLSDQSGAVIDNLFNPDSILASLDRACRKTLHSSIRIRSSAAHLDFSKQLPKLIDACE